MSEKLIWSEADFGISYADRMDIWTSALNRILEDLELHVKAEVERYTDDRDHLKEKDRIKIRVERT